MGNSSSSSTKTPMGKKVVQAKLGTSSKTGVLNLSNQGLKGSSSVFNQLKASGPEGPLYVEKLRTLDLSQNPLKAVPSCVCMLVNLKYLTVSACQLQGMGDLSMLVQLVSLKLSHNLLTNESFDNAENILPPNITQLDLSYNSFAAVPSNLFGVLCLSVLNMSHNQIHQVVHLVPCSGLTELDFDNNLIQELPECLSALSKLHTLSIANNLIKARGVIDPSSQSIHENLFTHSQLEKVNLKGNPISKQDFLSFNGVDKLLDRRKLTKDKLLHGGGLSDTSLFGLD